MLVMVRTRANDSNWGEKSSKAGKPVESVVVGGKFMSKPSGSSIDVRNRT